MNSGPLSFASTPLGEPPASPDVARPFMSAPDPGAIESLANAAFSFGAHNAPAVGYPREAGPASVNAGGFEVAPLLTGQRLSEGTRAPLAGFASSPEAARPFGGAPDPGAIASLANAALTSSVHNAPPIDFPQEAGPASFKTGGLEVPPVLNEQRLAEAARLALGGGGPASVQIPLAQIPSSASPHASLASAPSPDTAGFARPEPGLHPFAAAEAARGSYYFEDESLAAALQTTRAAESGHGRPSAHDSRVALPDPAGRRQFSPHMLRRDFPILRELVDGKPLIWLDNAATTQKPQSVIDRISHFYAHENSNVHRAAHALAARSTDAFEEARKKVAGFINAPSPGSIVWVRGTTEGINLVANAWGRRHVKAGDEVIVTHLEHHSNIVPWQMLCNDAGAKLLVAPVDDRGDILLDEYERLFTPRTRIAAFTHVSNALGTVTPAREMVEIAHRHGARVLVDGAQAVCHMPVDVQALDADFYVLSGHKMFGPTGIGAVYVNPSELEHLPPWQGGGSMIRDVTFEKSVFQDPPERFEAGTGSIADAVGLGAAIDYLNRVGMHNIAAYEHTLIGYALEGLSRVNGVKFVGSPRERAGAISLVMDEKRVEDVGAALSAEGIAVRAGHHCAQPILRRFGHEMTVRPSFAFYNTAEDVDALVSVLHRVSRGRS